METNYNQVKSDTIGCKLTTTGHQILLLLNPRMGIMYKAIYIVVEIP